MRVKFKVVGANNSTKHLMEEEGALIKTYNRDGVTIREILFNDKIHLFDEKNVDFLPDAVVACGWLSDNKSKVGRIALKFIPENEQTI
jgi:hypothetical protein